MCSCALVRMRAPGMVAGAPGSPSLKLAVRHALTTGFGTAAFGAAILFLIAAIRRSLRNAAGKNLCCAIINCLAQPLLALLEMFTKVRLQRSGRKRAVWQGNGVRVCEERPC